jgi:hypothetical protein
MNMESHFKTVTAIANLSPTHISVLKEAVGFLAAHPQSEIREIMDLNKESFAALSDLVTILGVGFAIRSYEEVA